MANNLIRVHKDFINLNIGILTTEKILETFYYICLEVKDKGSKEVTIDFSKMIKALGNIKKKDLIQNIFKLHDKLGELKIRYKDENGVGTIWLFDKLYNNINDNTLNVVVTESSLYFFNSKKNYLRFLFTDVRKLGRSLYPKLLLPYLMNKSNEKKLTLEKEELFDILNLDDSYRNDLSNFNRVILDKLEKLDIIFENFKIKKLKLDKTDPKIITGYEFTWTNDFDFSHNNEIKEAEEILDVKIKDKKEITPAEELEKWFKTTFPTVRYIKAIKIKLGELLKNNSLTYVKDFLEKNWHRAKEDKTIENVEKIFVYTIKEGVVLPLTKEEEKLEKGKQKELEKQKQNEKWEARGGNQIKRWSTDIVSIQEIAEQSKEVIKKIDVTEEEYNKIKQDWIDKQKEETSNSDMELLKTIFSASQSQKYNIIPAEKEETKLNLKYTKEVYEGKIKKTEYQIEFYKKELFKIMEDDDLELEELEEKRKYIEDKIENYKIKIEDYKKEILKLKEEKIKK